MWRFVLYVTEEEKTHHLLFILAFHRVLITSEVLQFCLFMIYSKAVNRLAECSAFTGQGFSCDSSFEVSCLALCLAFAKITLSLVDAALLQLITGANIADKPVFYVVFLFRPLACELGSLMSLFQALSSLTPFALSGECQFYLVKYGCQACVCGWWVDRCVSLELQVVSRLIFNLWPGQPASPHGWSLDPINW